MSDKKVIISPYGFDIKTDTLYEVQEKYDSSAPDGFQKNRTTKLMSFDIIDRKAGAVWDSDKGNWDTALYEGSKALNEAFPDVDLKSLIRNINDYIVRPFEKESGEGRLNHISSPETNEYWDNYKIEVGRGKIFDTSKPKDRLDLFLCLIHKRLTPKELESHPDFKGISQYVIVDQEGSISRESESELERMKASASFFTLLQNNKDDLFNILDYLGISVNKKTEQTTLVRVFNNWLDDKVDRYQNDRLFNKTVEEYNSKEGKDLFFIFSKLKELKTKDIVKVKRGEIYLDNVYVENGYKNAAYKIAKDSELRELFEQFLN